MIDFYIYVCYCKNTNTYVYKKEIATSVRNEYEVRYVKGEGNCEAD